jgi:hypothetical protein
MASVFVGVGPIMLFYLAKDPSPQLRSLLNRVPPLALTMGLVVLAYPTWVGVGVAAGLLYRESTVLAPGGGLGSANLAYTLGVIVVAAMFAAPLMIGLRRIAAGLAALALVFIGLFGWLVPFMAG